MSKVCLHIDSYKRPKTNSKLDQLVTVQLVAKIPMKKWILNTHLRWIMGQTMICYSSEEGHFITLTQAGHQKQLRIGLSIVEITVVLWHFYNCVKITCNHFLTPSTDSCPRKKYKENINIFLCFDIKKGSVDPLGTEIHLAAQGDIK
jgi:hypothetical protein